MFTHLVSLLSLSCALQESPGRAVDWLANMDASTMATGSTVQSSTSSSKYPQRNRKRNRFIFQDDEDNLTPGSAGFFQRMSSPSKRKLPNVQSGHGTSQINKPSNLTELGQLDRKVAHKVGLSLRTLLKLPKAYRWVCYEWFYANIDQALFLGENDFETCLRESFPRLKTRMLRRVEWCQIRRLMGKPRRCSAAFFAQERQALAIKRSKIRQLQQQKVVDIGLYRDLPKNIPLQLVIGTKVTALLRKPSEGLFTGTIDAIDTVNGTYRVNFDKTGIGSQAVPDYEVMSIEPPDYMPLSSFQSKVRNRMSILPNSKYFQLLAQGSPSALMDATSNDPLLSNVTFKSSTSNTVSPSISANGNIHHSHHSTHHGSSVHHNSTSGVGAVLAAAALTAGSNCTIGSFSGVGSNSFNSSNLVNSTLNAATTLASLTGSSSSLIPGLHVQTNDTSPVDSIRIKLFVLLVRLSKILSVKKRKIYELKSMNTEAEKMKTMGESISTEFKRQYANTILDLDRLNPDLNEFLRAVQLILSELIPDNMTIQPDLMKAKCYGQAKEIVERSLASCSIRNEATIDMISRLLSLMLHIKGLDTDVSSFELRSLDSAIQEIKETIKPENKDVFESSVEVHMNHITSIVSHLGNLGAFAESTVHAASPTTNESVS